MSQEDTHNFKNQTSDEVFSINVSTHVRISHLWNVFTREYDEKWSGELFLISERRLRGGIPMYTLIHYSDEDIKGFLQTRVAEFGFKGR